MSCLCETGDLTPVGAGMGSAMMRIGYEPEGEYDFEVGGWFLYVEKDYEEVTVLPIYYCPMCGREL